MHASHTADWAWKRNDNADRYEVRQNATKAIIKRVGISNTVEAAQVSSACNLPLRIQQKNNGNIFTIQDKNAMVGWSKIAKKLQ